VARIVALSSLVARGHVGLRALTPALESFGHDVIALPTVVLSNHAAYPHVARTLISPDVLDAMGKAIEANGWLRGVDGIITGYLPSAAHVSFAEALVRRVRAASPAALYVCDPVLGDEPNGLYVPEETARQIKHCLLPIADLATPNAFELSWLTERSVSALQDAKAAAQGLGPSMVLATSVPASGDCLATLLHDATGTAFTSVARRPKVPHGTGDLLAGLFTGALASGRDARAALAYAGARLETVLRRTGLADDLNLTPLFEPEPELSPLTVHTAT
jgi:pyridoxine kinase